MSQSIKIGDLNCTVVDAPKQPQAAAILCHGFGAPGTDLVPIAQELRSAFPELDQVQFLFPQAPIELDPVYDSRAWWMIDVEKIQSLMMTGEFRELRKSHPPELTERRQQINAVVDHVLKTYELSAEKVIVGGFSQGAMLATDVILNYPKQLGGLIVWSGTLLNEQQWVAAAERRQPLKIVQSHGRLDPILPFAGAEFLRDMLTQHGHHVEFIPFDGQHTIGLEAMRASVDLLKSVL